MHNLSLQFTSFAGTTADITKHWMQNDILAHDAGSIAKVQLDLYLAHK